VNVLLVPAHPGFPGQIPQSRKTVVCVVCLLIVYKFLYMFTYLYDFVFSSFSDISVLYIVCCTVLYSS